jgi:hypothetical protein
VHQALSRRAVAQDLVASLTSSTGMRSTLTHTNGIPSVNYIQRWLPNIAGDSLLRSPTPFTRLNISLDPVSRFPLSQHTSRYTNRLLGVCRASRAHWATACLASWIAAYATNDALLADLSGDENGRPAAPAHEVEHDRREAQLTGCVPEADLKLLFLILNTMTFFDSNGTLWDHLDPWSP